MLLASIDAAESTGVVLLSGCFCGSVPVLVASARGQCSCQVLTSLKSADASSVQRVAISPGGPGSVIDICKFRGQWRKFRQRVIEVADLQPAEVVLDVGCGTGTLALLAKKRVGPVGRVVGIDPGAEQIAWAGRKAAWRNVSVEFQVGVIEQLPCSDQSFDVVLSTLMMHYLPDSLKRRGLAEVERVLKPDGRLVVADFLHRQERQGRAVHFQTGGSRAQAPIALVRESDFEVAVTEELRSRRCSAFPGAVIVCATKNAG